MILELQACFESVEISKQTGSPFEKTVALKLITICFRVPWVPDPIYKLPFLHIIFSLALDLMVALRDFW